MTQSKSAVVSTFSMAMMTAAAVVSLRGLPMMAKEQLTLFVYVAFATFIFLIPAALVSAELGGAFGAKGGGVYTWVREAFGSRWAFVAIWLQWIQNVVWYPTVLAFSAAAIAYMVGKPDLANNGPFVGVFCIIAYWAATLITLRGVSAIARVTSWAFLAGTVLPGVVIMVLAVIWIIQGNPIAMLHPAATDAAAVMSMAGGHPHPRYFPYVTGHRLPGRHHPAVRGGGSARGACE
jgi:amino acid transporter